MDVRLELHCLQQGFFFFFFVAVGFEEGWTSCSGCLCLGCGQCIRCSEEPAGLWSCATLTCPTGYLCNQSMMRSAAIILDTEECFHTSGIELLVIRGRAGS